MLCWVWLSTPLSNGCDNERGIFTGLFFLVILHTSHIIHHSPHTTHHTSHITHHTSHITHHTSHITHHTSHITHHTSCILLPSESVECEVLAAATRDAKNSAFTRVFGFKMVLAHNTLLVVTASTPSRVQASAATVALCEPQLRMWLQVMRARCGGGRQGRRRRHQARESGRRTPVKTFFLCKA